MVHRGAHGLAAEEIDELFDQPICEKPRFGFGSFRVFESRPMFVAIVTDHDWIATLLHSHLAIDPGPANPLNWSPFIFDQNRKLRCLHVIDWLVLDPRGQEGVQSDVILFKPGGYFFHEMDGELAGPFVHYPDR